MLIYTQKNQSYPLQNSRDLPKKRNVYRTKVEYIYCTQ